MAPLLLALALAGSSAASPRTNVTLICDGCFGLKVDLDGQKLMSVAGVGGRVQDGQLGVAKNPRFEGLTPGTHHIRVEILQGPIDSTVAYDGPAYLRPGAEMTFKVRAGGLDEVPPPTPAPPSVPAGRSALTLRADDGAICELTLDGAPLFRLQQERVLRAENLKPGLHHLEVRTLRGQVLTAGSLYLGSGEDATAGVVCQTGAFQVFSDPFAFHPEPRR